MPEPNNQITKEHPDLYQRSIKGGYWVFAIKAATQFLGFVKSIIVFNFLFKANLELIIVANLLMAILTTSTESGFHAALIQKKDDIADYLDTAWVIDIVRGILLFALIYLIAPWFASFPRLVPPENVSLAVSVIRAMGICFLIRAFQNIGVVYFRKELEFHKTFWLTMAGTVTDIVLAIVLVLMLQSVWGYVIARLAATAVNLVMSYWLCSFRPRFHFVPERARELWRFGKWLFGGQIIGYLLNEGDDWFVGFYLGGGPLKLYRYAYRFANMPATHITNTISQVSFPAYAKIQHDLPRLREAYLKVLQLTAMISIPTAFLIFTLGPDFVRLFLVPESHAMIPVVQILAFKGLIKSLGATRGPLWYAVGKVKLVLYFKWMRLVILCLTIYPLAKIWGISGVASAIILFSVVVAPFGLHYSKKLLESTNWEMVKPCFIPGVATGIMVFVTGVLLSAVDKMNIVLFFGIFVFYSAGYLILLWSFDHYFKLGIKKFTVDQMMIMGLIKENRN